jgi:hypothetical protein
MEGRYSNLQMIYFAGLKYGGYIMDRPVSEPYSYETNFAVKWLIEERTADWSGEGAWLAWGPYMWTDGLRGRSDGFIWRCEYHALDGHTGPLGAKVLAGLLLDFFKTNETARPWFVRNN